MMLRNGAAPALGHCGGGDRRDFRGTLGERGLLEIWVGRAGGGRETLLASLQNQIQFVFFSISNSSSSQAYPPSDSSPG